MNSKNDQLPKVLTVGFSHLGVLEHAYEQRVLQGNKKFEMDFINFNLERLRPLFIAKDGKRIYNQLIKDEIIRRLENGSSSRSMILASFWGNEHFFLSVCNNPRPFDFILPQEPERELSPGAEVIPYDLMYALLNEICSAHYNLISFIKTFVSCPIFAISAPPPVEDVLLIKGGTSDQRLDDKVKELGVAPSTLRYKFWKVCEEIHRKKSIEQGAIFASVPGETVDSKGFRKHEYFGTDWLHGSVSYGELVLRQVDKSLVDDGAMSPSK